MCFSIFVIIKIKKWDLGYNSILLDCDEIIIIIIVRTQFVTTPNWYWVRTFEAQTIKFVERGLERLGLGHRRVDNHGTHGGRIEVS